MSSGHAWCQVVKILRGHTSTRHLSGRGRGGGGAECRAPEFSALWTARATGAGWGWAMFERLVNRNVAHTAALKGSPTPTWASAPSWRQSCSPCPPASDVLGFWEGGQPSASPSLAHSHCWRLLAAAASLPAH